MASSTTSVTARTRANKVKRFIDMPNTGRAANVPIKETGIAIQGTNEALQSPKNTNITRITIKDVIKIVSATSFIDSLMNKESSNCIFIFKVSGSVLLSCSIFLFTRFTMLTVFAPGRGTI